jgi:endonuclease/exonuclease/phosphatase family metal-dependent hydrolase
MTSLRLIAWNCHHGSLSARLSELAEHTPDIVFVQECQPAETLPLDGQFFTRRIDSLKGIALGSMNAGYHLAELQPHTTGGVAALGAAVMGPVSLRVLGIWAQAPNYVDDVVQTLDAYDDVLRAGPSVVMGDLNSGTNLKAAQAPGKDHTRILARLADLELVSAYHSFHEVEHGHEKHPTYRHLFRPSEPWHIDFCFVPRSWFVSRVELLGGQKWTTQSDHFPLKVDVQLSRLAK